MPEERDLEVIIPAYNEERRIGGTLRAIAEQLSDMGLAGRAAIRVVDNGSADRTADVVDLVGAERDGVEITVQGCAQQGKGRAVERGVLTSRAPWIGFCDADLATPASAIGEAVRHLEAGWPVVIGSRHRPGAGFRLATRVIAGPLEVADSQCGFKFFKREAAHRIFSMLVTGGFAFDVDVLHAARFLGYGVKEFPVSWSDRTGSTFNVVRHGPQVTRELWEVRRARRRRQHSYR